MFILAIVLPGLYFIVTGNIIRGIVALILQVTVVGWIPVAIWAVKFRNEKIRKGELKETSKQDEGMVKPKVEPKVEPKFEIGDKLKSYVATWQKGFGGGHWKIEGESSPPNLMQVVSMKNILVPSV